jgi:Putative prokaryotic signal transducing protein
MEAVTLTVVGSDVEAEMVCGLLRSNGIRCSYRKTNYGAAIGDASGVSMTGPTEVLVDEHDLEAARRLLMRL